jgi:type I restriction enzyme M protein
VPKQELIDNDYDLSLSKYKEEVYEEVSYDKPKDILKRIDKIEGVIVKELGELKELIN